MKVLVMSMVANSVKTLPRYLEQLQHLRTALSFRGDMLTALVCEGDSIDGSWSWLQEHMPPWVELMQCHHGGLIYTSQVNPIRFRQLSMVWNTMLDRVAQMEGVDVVVLVEDDLIIYSDDMIGLIDSQRHHGGIVCPMVYIGPLFYDTWAYRRNGTEFRNWPRPYHPELTDDIEYLELDSAGSCMAMSWDIAATIRTTAEEELVGFCKNATGAGHQIRLMPTYACDHDVKSPVVDTRYQRGQIVRPAIARPRAHI